MSSAETSTPADEPTGLRPTSLRALIAWYFALSMKDFHAELGRPQEAGAASVGTRAEDTGRGDGAGGDTGPAGTDAEESVPDDAEPDGVGPRAAEPETIDTGSIGPAQTIFEKRLRQLLWWPPDVFAFTSAVLARTGLYRLVAGPSGPIGDGLWKRIDWQLRVAAHAEAWRSAVSESLLKPMDVGGPAATATERSERANDELLRKIRKRVRERSRRRHVSPDARPGSTLEQGPRANAGPFDNLFELFIHDLCRLKGNKVPLADQNLLALSVDVSRHGRPGSGDPEAAAARFFEAIIGLHILADEAAGSIGMPRKSTSESAVFDGLANVLLTLRGSLSTLPKFHGVVLPKLRTPQSGLTLRNLSHNLTFHDSEVEVMWRSFPWANLDENTLNVLYVPYPFDFEARRFKHETEHHESVGYYTYDPGTWDRVGSAVDLLDEVRKEGVTPHFLVFSEMALSEDAYKALLSALSRRSQDDGDPRRMPVVIAGVAATEDDPTRTSGTLPYNELRMATYFAGKWYELKQQKHHRWRLDANQIKQYGLQGHLSTARPLFERSVVDQRRLTFFAPAPWLVVSPLICEDLSRIEPVSELVRGVGPTLVLALLLDGPQVRARWPGRYAHALADDPGSSVLTVTSYGAARASRRSEDLAKPPDPPDRAIVASWKDIDQFHELSAADQQALLITLTAVDGDEVTLDRRTVRHKAGGFRFDGVRPFDMPVGEPYRGIDRQFDLGTWSDIREVTAVTYVASAALSLLKPHLSRHTNKRKRRKRTDSWVRMKRLGEHAKAVRALIDTMVGEALILPIDPDARPKSTWRRVSPLGKGKVLSLYKQLKDSRNRLLDHIVGGVAHARYRHLFSVLGFSQSTIDIEVRDEEAKWPMPSLAYAAIVVRVLFDTIAGFDPATKEIDEKAEKEASDVYTRRIRIAGRYNRRGAAGGALWDTCVEGNAEEGPGTASEGGDTCPEEDAESTLNDLAEVAASGPGAGAPPKDVRGAPEPLLSSDRRSPSRSKLRYLRNMRAAHNPSAALIPLPDVGHFTPTRYDFYRMAVEIARAFLEDEEASLWMSTKEMFYGQLGEGEMRRVTLLVLMMVPALIHEQLEHEHIRSERNGSADVDSAVIRDLLHDTEELLRYATQKARGPWRPRRT